MTPDALNETLQNQDQITEQVIALVMAKRKNASTYFINKMTSGLAGALR